MVTKYTIYKSESFINSNIMKVKMLAYHVEYTVV